MSNDPDQPFGKLLALGAAGIDPFGSTYLTSEDGIGTLYGDLELGRLKACCSHDFSEFR
jgi:hypothetical protein